MIYYVPMVSALITAYLTSILLHSRFGKGIQDIPNERSMHKTPVPRIGGVALMTGVFSGWMLIFDSLSWSIVMPLLTLFIISVLDDIHGLSVYKRLLVHIVSVAIFITGSGLLTHQGWIVAIVACLIAVWMTNLYNFMDGSDGLAGGMAVFGFGTYGIAALLNQDEAFATLNLSIAAAALGFLYHNFHPAKVFMGDAGSIPLGFLAAAIGIWGWQNGSWAAWFPLLVFSPFIVDASATLLKRILLRVNISEAHREHYYQRAIRLGWGHRNIALIEYGLMFAVATSALANLKTTFPGTLLAGWAAIFAGLMLFLDIRWKNFILTRHD